MFELRTEKRNKKYACVICTTTIRLSNIVPLSQFRKDKFQGKIIPFYYRDIDPTTIKNRQFKDIFKTHISKGIRLTWFVVDHYKHKFIMICARPTNWCLQDFKVVSGLLPLNKYAIQLCKKMRVHGPALMGQYKSDRPEKFNKKYINELMSTESSMGSKEIKFDFSLYKIPKTRLERYRIGVDFLDFYLKNNITTYETAYLLIGRFLYESYIEKNEPYIELFECNSLRAHEHIFISITYGCEKSTLSKKNTNYIFTYPKNDRLLCDISNIKYIIAFKKFMKKKRLRYKSPGII